MALFSLCTGFLLIGFQNCGTEFKPSPQSLQNRPLELNDCQQDASVQTCLFDGSPETVNSAASQTLQETQLTNGDLDLEIFDESILDVPELKNELLKVRHVSGSTLQQKSGHYRYSLNETDTNPIGQLMAFYFGTHFIESHPELESYFQNNPISIVVDSGFSGWSPRLRTIYLSRKIQASMAFDGSLVVYYISYAYLESISNPNQDDISLYELACNQSQKACSTREGNYKTLLYGLAEVLTALYFQDSKSQNLGAYWNEASQAKERCSWGRNPAQNDKLTLGQAYQGCPSADGLGDLVIMGSYVASLFWEAYEKDVNQEEDFYAFYFNVAESLQISDTLAGLVESPLFLKNSIGRGLAEDFNQRQ